MTRAIAITLSALALALCLSAPAHAGRPLYCGQSDLQLSPDAVLTESLTVTGMGPDKLCKFGALGELEETTLGDEITGTANQITVTPSGSGVTLGTPQNLGTDSSPTFADVLISPSYERHFSIPVGVQAAGGGGITTVNLGHFLGHNFTTNAHQVFSGFLLPHNWDDVTDVHVHLHWGPNGQMTNGQTVIWNLSYKSVDEDQGYDAPTATTASTTYTQVGTSAQYARTSSEFILNPADINNPLATMEQVGFIISRDATTDTYNGGAVLTEIHVEFKVKSLTNSH